MGQVELIMKAFGFAVICTRTWQSFCSLTPGPHVVANAIDGSYSTWSDPDSRHESDQEDIGSVFICVLGLFQVKSQHFHINH